MLQNFLDLKKSHKIFLLLLGVVLLIVTICTGLFIQYKDNEVLDETVAIFSDIEGGAAYTDLLGNTVSLEKYLGKVMVVASWASWSPFSQNDLLMLSELAEQYNSGDVVFLAINRKENKEQAMRYVSTLPTLANVVVVLDPRDHFYSAVGGYAMPELLVYNQKGEIAGHFRGVAPKEEVRTLIDQNLTKI